MENKYIRQILAVKSLVALTFMAMVVSVHAEATTLERIKATGVITVCADPNNLPLSDSKLSPPGYDIEIAEEIAKDFGAKLHYNWFVTEHMGKVFRELYDGTCDFIVSIPTDKRLEGVGPRLALSRPYLVSGFAFVLGKSSQETKLQDLTGVSVGVGLNTVSDFVAFDRGHDRVLFSKQSDVFDALAKGEVHAGLVWAPMAGWLAKQRPASQVRILSETYPELVFSLAIGVRSDEPAFLDAINESIGRIVRSGKRDQILAKYGVPQLNLKSGSPDGRNAWPARKFATIPVRDSQSYFVSAVLRRPLSMAYARSDAQSPFIRTVGGAAKSSVWPPSDEDEGKGAQEGAAVSKVQVSPPSKPQGQGNGFNLYHQACGKCHGRNAISGGVFPDLRRFEGTDEDFLNTAKNGREGTVMPAWKKVFTDAELVSIRNYIKSVPAD